MFDDLLELVVSGLQKTDGDGAVKLAVQRSDNLVNYPAHFSIVLNSFASFALVVHAPPCSFASNTAPLRRNF